MTPSCIYNWVIGRHSTRWISDLFSKFLWTVIISNTADLTTEFKVAIEISRPSLQESLFNYRTDDPIICSTSNLWIIYGFNIAYLYLCGMAILYDHPRDWFITCRGEGLISVASRWCHDMNACSILLTLCEGNPPVYFPPKRTGRWSLTFLCCSPELTNSCVAGDVRHREIYVIYIYIYKFALA